MAALRAAIVAGAALGYFLAARLGYAVAVGGGTVTLWPPAGLTLALLLLSPGRWWPLVGAGAAAGSFASDLISHYSLLAASAAAVANVGESLMGAWALKRVMHGRIELTPRGVAALTLVVVVATNAVTALAGMAMLASVFTVPLPLGWFVWWAGDGLGILIVTPPILAVAAAWRARVSLSRARVAEAALITVLLVATAVLAVGPPRGLPLAIGSYLTFPFLFWAALRFGTLGATLATLVLAAVVTWFASHKQGPFVPPNGAVWKETVEMYLYLAVASLSALLFGATIEARQAAEDRLRRSEERIRQSQKLEAIGRLAGGIAHDFNNLLTVIQGGCDLLGETVNAGTQQHEDLGQIRSATQRATALTHQLLAFSRRKTLAPQPLRVQHVLSSVRPMLERLLGGQIVIDMPPSAAAPILADLSQLEQIVLNLAVNARDAMPDGGVLRFEVDDVALDGDAAVRLDVTRGRYVRVNVSDTGSGIDSATREHLFEPFFTTKPEGVGTGLGLATVHGIVQQSHGAIEVRSEPGRGTTFSLYFPDAST